MKDEEQTIRDFLAFAENPGVNGMTGDNWASSGGDVNEIILHHGIHYYPRPISDETRDSLIRNFLASRKPEYVDWDSRMAAEILPLMKGFRAEMDAIGHKSHPQEMSWEEWDAIINECIWAFESYIDLERHDDNDSDRRQAAFEAFGKHFTGFWV